MKILPVLDLLGGEVVRGVAGVRQAYRPIQSVLTDSSQPLRVAEAIRARFSLSEMYVADLDAILHRRPNLSALQSLSRAGFRLLVDAGVRQMEDAVSVIESGVDRIIAGLETLSGPDSLARIMERWGAGRVVFSLDLRNGEPLGNRGAWATSDPLAIAQAAIGAGCTQLIVLDLARVGTSEGVPTLPLCREIRRAFPNVTIITGGGIRGIDDLRGLRGTSVDGVLIASALHNGSIQPGDLNQLNRPCPE